MIEKFRNSLCTPRLGFIFSIAKFLFNLCVPRLPLQFTFLTHSNFFIFFVLNLIIQVFSISAFSGEISPTVLDQIASVHFETDSQRRVGIEIELKGLSTLQIAEILQRSLGGRLEEQTVPVDAKSKDGKKITLQVTRYKLKGSVIGRVLIKPEDNSLTVEDLANQAGKSNITEIVTEPITVEKAMNLQNAADHLVKAGARGTDASTAVSIQINVEINNGNPESGSTKAVLDILRNYLQPENHKLISSIWNVPKVRSAYLGSFQPGFMKKLLNPKYNPTWSELFNDFVYHQCLESLGHQDAWTISDQEASNRLEKIVAEKGFDVLLPIMKWNHVKLGSLLMHVKPNEWISKLLARSYWIKGIPALEFRDPNNDFHLEKTLSRIIGFVEASETLGFHSLNQLTTPKSKMKASKCRNIFSDPLGSGI